MTVPGLLSIRKLPAGSSNPQPSRTSHVLEPIYIRVDFFVHLRRLRGRRRVFQMLRGHHLQVIPLIVGSFQVQSR